MRVVVSMLRGVNLGPHKRMKMDALRGMYEALGLRAAQTCVQSGNVLFKSGEKDLKLLAARIEKEIEKTFGFSSDVILRSTAELRDVVAKNPFKERRNVEAARLLVTFFRSDPGEDARQRVRAIPVSGEQLWIDGRELYIHFPDGVGSSKLTAAVLDKALKVSGTARNWNSVTKLLALAEAMEASA